MLLLGGTVGLRPYALSPDTVSMKRSNSVFQYILVLIRLFFFGYYHIFYVIAWTCDLTAGPVCRKSQTCSSDHTVLILR